MNNKLWIICGLLALNLTACLQDITREDIYVYESGELVDAQNYVVSIPPAGGQYVVKIVSYGIWKVEILGQCPSNVSVFFDESSQRIIYEVEEFIYDSNTKGTINRYIEDIVVSFPPNKGCCPKGVKCRVHTAGKDGHIADILFRQNSK